VHGLLALAEGSVGAAIDRLGDAIAIESRLGRCYGAALDARTRAAAFLEPLAA
jgi:hypothetical protein